MQLPVAGVPILSEQSHWWKPAKTSLLEWEACRPSDGSLGTTKGIAPASPPELWLWPPQDRKSNFVEYSIAKHPKPAWVEFANIGRILREALSDSSSGPAERELRPMATPLIADFANSYGLLFTDPRTFNLRDDVELMQQWDCESLSVWIEEALQLNDALQLHKLLFADKLSNQEIQRWERIKTEALVRREGELWIDTLELGFVSEFGLRAFPPENLYIERLDWSESYGDLARKRRKRPIELPDSSTYSHNAGSVRSRILLCSSTFHTELWQAWKAKGDLTECLSSFIAESVNEKLAGRVLAELQTSKEEEQLQLKAAFRPMNLHGAIWLQFMRHAAGNEHFVECPVCGVWYDAEGSRSRRIYCSDRKKTSCRNRGSRFRRFIEREGLSPEEAARKCHIEPRRIAELMRRQGISYKDR